MKKVATGKRNKVPVEIKISKGEPDPKKASEGKRKRDKVRKERSERAKRVFHGKGSASSKATISNSKSEYSQSNKVKGFSKKRSDHPTKAPTRGGSGSSKKTLEGTRVKSEGTTSPRPAEKVGRDRRTKNKKGSYKAERTTNNAYDETNIDDAHEIELPAPAETPAIIDKLDRRLRRIVKRGTPIHAQNKKGPSDRLIRSICALIRLGNYPEVACRAFGIAQHIFRSWVEKGFIDLNENRPRTQFAKFVTSVDVSDAQSEVLDIEQIAEGNNNWQSRAWIRERKSFQRWGMRALQIQSDISAQISASKSEPIAELEPEVAAEVLVALEEAGIVAQSGFEHLSGIPEAEPIPCYSPDDETNESLSDT